MIVVYHKNFIKSFKKSSKKIKDKFGERLAVFNIDEFDPILNNHSLQGKYEGYRSINISGDVRAIFKRRAKDAIFVTINSHSNLYG